MKQNRKKSKRDARARAREIEMMMMIRDRRGEVLKVVNYNLNRCSMNEDHIADRKSFLTSVL